MRGTSYRLAWRQTVSDCGSTPDVPQKTTTAPSRTRSERSTSIVKSTWPAGVDDVDAVLVELSIHALPEARGRRRRDGDATFLLLFHPVHHGRAVVHLADLVRQSGVEQHTFGRRRLPRVDVGDDADVPVAADGSAASHFFASSVGGPTRGPPVDSRVA